MGSPPWSQRGTKGGGQTVAVQNRPSIETIDATQTGSVASGSVELTEVYAPTGSVFNVSSLLMQTTADGTATSGTHQFNVKTLNNVEFLFGRSNYTSKINFRYGVWETADALKYPSNEAASAQMMSLLKATENKPIAIEYGNNTDVAHDPKRSFLLAFEEVTY